MTDVKVVRFLDREPEGLRSRWAAVAAHAGRDPGRPARVAVAAPLPGFAPSPWTVVDLQWFASVTEALANDAWLAAVAPDLRDGSCRVVATEVVLRGRAYLDARWREGGERLKMMSFGRRNPALTPEEFSARWRSEAGRLGAEQIPDAVRGLAYVQNHPVPLDGQEWPLDAVNEVYVEGLDQLRRREAWFAERRAATLRSDAQSLMAPTETWSMFVREWSLSP